MNRFVSLKTHAVAATVCLLVALAPSWLQAQGPPTQDARSTEPSSRPGRVLALLVGINEYQNQNIARLRFAVTDARAIRDRVIPKMPGLQHRVHLLENHEATSAKILTALDSLSAAARSDTVLIYLALHGVTEATATGRKGFLVSYDTDPGNTKSTGVPVDTLVSKLSAIPADRVFVMLDSCFSGSAVSGWAGGARTFSFGPTRRGDHGFSEDMFKEVGKRRGHFVLSASRPDEDALELNNLRHGLFTYFLVQGLEGAAADPTTGHVTVADLYKFVSRQVEDFATGLQRKQTPMMDGKFEGQPPIMTVARRPTKPSQAELAALIIEAKRSFESSKLIVKGNGADKIELYVAGDLKWSGSDRERDFQVSKEEFDRHGKEIQVRVVAIPNSRDRKREERTFSLRQGDLKEVAIESTVLPAAPPQRPPARVFAPMP